MRYKERPCPGCGKVEERRAQRLCRDCIRQLRLGKKREQEIEKLRVSRERIQVAIDTDFHCGAGGAHLGFLAIGDWDVLDALVHLGGLEDASGSGGTYKKARPIHFTYSIPYHFRPHQYVLATPKQADDIELILDYIELVIKKAYEDGHADGRSLIRRLATAGAEDLNRITTGRTRLAKTEDK